MGQQLLVGRRQHWVAALAGNHGLQPSSEECQLNKGFFAIRGGRRRKSGILQVWRGQLHPVSSAKPFTVRSGTRRQAGTCTHPLFPTKDRQLGSARCVLLLNMISERMETLVLREAREANE